MRIQDYKAATAKLKEFSEFYEANRYKTFEEMLIESRRDQLRESLERMQWAGGYMILDGTPEYPIITSFKDEKRRKNKKVPR